MYLLRRPVPPGVVADWRLGLWVFPVFTGFSWLCTKNDVLLVFIPDGSRCSVLFFPRALVRASSAPVPVVSFQRRAATPRGFAFWCVAGCAFVLLAGGHGLTWDCAAGLRLPLFRPGGMVPSSVSSGILCVRGRAQAGAVYAGDVGAGWLRVGLEASRGPVASCGCASATECYCGPAMEAGVEWDNLPVRRRCRWRRWRCSLWSAGSVMLTAAGCQSGLTVMVQVLVAALAPCAGPFWTSRLLSMANASSRSPLRSSMALTFSLKARSKVKALPLWVAGMLLEAGGEEHCRWVLGWRVLLCSGR